MTVIIKTNTIWSWLKGQIQELGVYQLYAAEHKTQVWVYTQYKHELLSTSVKAGVALRC